MHKLQKLALSTLIALAPLSSHADINGGEAAESLASLTEYLKNLGAYLGFDVTNAPPDGAVSTLVDLSASTLAQQYSFVTYLGAVPVNAYSDVLSRFVPSNTANYTVINDMANYTFANQPSGGSYNSADGSSVNVSSLIDQQTYQKDPISQFVLNILGTPQTTYCMNNDATAYTSDCSYLYDTKVMTNVVGPIPSTEAFFSYDYNQDILAQLNADTLLGPLMYNTDNESSSTSSSDSQSSSDEGLKAENQMQTAHNFIRYATGMTNPIALAKRSDYDNLYLQSISTDDSVSDTDRQLAKENLAKYILKIRSYSARVSIGASNLYFMLSKRLPQSQSADQSSSNQANSQALSEFQMATRRLYDPAKKEGSNNNAKQWIDEINEASTATVQKEIAVLLSEINYQLYLSRQIDERILATLSVLGAAAVTPPAFSSSSIATKDDAEEG